MVTVAATTPRSRGARGRGRAARPGRSWRTCTDRRSRPGIPRRHGPRPRPARAGVAEGPLESSPDRRSPGRRSTPSSQAASIFPPGSSTYCRSRRGAAWPGWADGSAGGALCPLARYSQRTLVRWAARHRFTEPRVFGSPRDWSRGAQVSQFPEHRAGHMPGRVQVPPTDLADQLGHRGAARTATAVVDRRHEEPRTARAARAARCGVLCPAPARGALGPADRPGQDRLTGQPPRPGRWPARPADP